MAGTSPAMTKKRVIAKLLEESKNAERIFGQAHVSPGTASISCTGIDATLVLSHNFAG
jgi:hypothetical protein